MPTFWDLLPASLWLTQPFIPPVDPGQRSAWTPNPVDPWESAASTPDYVVPNATVSLGSWDDDRYQQKLADAKRAYDFVMWHFGRPSREPILPERSPQDQPPQVPRKAPPAPRDSIESAPLRPPVPPDGYNEWDKLDRFYEDTDFYKVDPRVLSPNPDPGQTLDTGMVIHPRNILMPQFSVRRGVALKPTRE
jgi:hypothetical protein